MATTATEEGLATAQAVYQLEGTMLDACSCGVLCPCWIGEDPDGGECFSLIAYHFTSGRIRGIDVSGVNFVMLQHIPGNVLTPTSWRIVRFVDARATDEQDNALLGAFRGEYGGPLADLASLVGEELGVGAVEIDHEVADAKGRPPSGCGVFSLIRSPTPAARPSRRRARSVMASPERSEHLTERNTTRGRNGGWLADVGARPPWTAGWPSSRRSSAVGSPTPAGRSRGSNAREHPH